MLTVALGRYLDTCLVQADVQPTLVRLLIRGRLLQLRLPEEVRPDASSARRSRASGRLVVSMPKLEAGGRGTSTGGSGGGCGSALAAAGRATCCCGGTGQHAPLDGLQRAGVAAAVATDDLPAVA